MIKADKIPDKYNAKLFALLIRSTPKIFTYCIFFWKVIVAYKFICYANYIRKGLLLYNHKISMNLYYSLFKHLFAHLSTTFKWLPDATYDTTS